MIKVAPKRKAKALASPSGPPKKPPVVVKAATPGGGITTFIVRAPTGLVEWLEEARRTLGERDRNATVVLLLKQVAKGMGRVIP